MNNNSSGQTFKSFCKFDREHRHCQLAAVVRLTTANVIFLYVEVVKVYGRSVVANTNCVDDATWRTRDQLVKQQVCKQKMT